MQHHLPPEREVLPLKLSDLIVLVICGCHCSIESSVGYGASGNCWLRDGTASSRFESILLDSVFNITQISCVCSYSAYFTPIPVVAVSMVECHLIHLWDTLSMV